MLSGKTISDLLYNLYEFSEQWDFDEHTLHVLDDYIPSSISGYEYTSIDSRMLVRMRTHDHDGVHLPSNDKLSSLLSAHPFLDYYCSSRLGPVICTLDILTEDEWKSSELYSELYEPFGLQYDMSVRYYNDQICISFTFTNDVPLSAEHRRILNLIAPHLGNARHSYELQKKGLYSSLPDNTVLFSMSGGVMECSAEARRLLRTYHPDEPRSAVCDIPDSVLHLVRNRIRRFSLNHDHLSANMLRVEGEHAELVMTILRHPAGFLLLLEEVHPGNPIEDIMAMGLTRREAEVLKWVAQGKQNSEIASILGIRTATVRKHVEHILDKLKCETRGAAGLLALRAQRDSKTGFDF